MRIDHDIINIDNSFEDDIDLNDCLKDIDNLFNELGKLNYKKHETEQMISIIDIDDIDEAKYSKIIYPKEYLYNKERRILIYNDINCIVIYLNTVYLYLYLYVYLLGKNMYLYSRNKRNTM